MIISGFPCVGKSWCQKNRPEKIIDLESSVFCRGNFEQYVDYIEYLDQEGFIVFCSAHDAVRDLLRRHGTPYIFIKPDMGDKEEYRKRSDNRQPHPLSTEILMTNWERFLEVKPGECCLTLPQGSYVGQQNFLFQKGNCMQSTDEIQVYSVYSESLEEYINRIGYDSILKIIPEYSGQEGYFNTRFVIISRQPKSKITEDIFKSE